MAAPHFGVREQDQYMPIANVIRIMRRILPSHAKISDDAKETIQECVSEYISFITGEANERCQREQRKTVTAEDVLWAMGKLGFDEYVEPLTVYLQRYRESEGDRSSHRGGEDSIAVPAVRRNNIANYGPGMMMPPAPPPSPSAAAASYGSAFPVAPNPFTGMFDPSVMMSGYRDGLGASDSSSSMTSYDPFGHLKRDRL